MEIIQNKALLVSADQHEQITSKIERSKLVRTENGDTKVAVYWGLKEAQQLTSMNLGKVPSTIERDYQWTGRYSPFEHQRETSGFLTLNKRAFCFNEQGTGKTASVIWAADYLLRQKAIKRVLVICPLSIMKSAWQQDLFTFAMHRSCSIAYGSAAQRKRILADGAEFVIINFDGIGVIEEEIARGGFDLIVVDEANAYKNPKTNRWKLLNRILLKTDPYLWMLTGTPAAQSPVDAYGLAKMVNPEGCPKYLNAFRDKVMFQVTRFKWIPKPDAQETVHSILQPAIRFEKKDCLDLPPVTYLDRESPLTPQQKRYYDDLASQMLIEAAGEEISAVNAAAKINKLLQISGGAAYTDTGEVVEFDVSHRLKAVLEVIEEAANKVLVFVPFTHTIELLKDYLTKNKISCEVINGKVHPNKRASIVEEFQSKDTPRVLLIQPQAASHGLTLTAADTIVWYAPVTSVETYLQANARIDRPGQKHKMTVVHIRGSDVEARLYKLLRGNINNHEKLIDLYREMMKAS